jgi:hypothetical protein
MDIKHHPRRRYCACPDCCTITVTPLVDDVEDAEPQVTGIVNDPYIGAPDGTEWDEDV